MELSIEDIRLMIGGYVLELMVKEREIVKLKAEIEQLTNKENPSKPHALVTEFKPEEKAQ